MSNFSSSVALAAGLLAFGAPLTRAQFSLSSGFDYTSGDYGLSEDTRMFTVPFTATYVSDQWTFRASLPYLRISGPAYVVPDLGQVGGLRPVSTTESGLGDLVLSGSYALPTAANRPAFDLTAKVKLGTADEARGLGTGENDVYVQGDVYQVYGDIAPFATLGYRFLGDPSGFRLKDGFYASAGVSYRWSEPTRVGAILDWRQRAVSGGDAAMELTAFVTHRVDERWRVQVYAVKGFSDASPDAGLGGVVGYAF
jgi:hypothetical protein